MDEGAHFFNDDFGAGAADAVADNRHGFAGGQAEVDDFDAVLAVADFVVVDDIEIGAEVLEAEFLFREFCEAAWPHEASHEQQVADISQQLCLFFRIGECRWEGNVNDIFRPEIGAARHF